MFQAIQKSKLLIRSVRAIAQTANLAPVLTVPTFTHSQQRWFSSNAEQTNSFTNINGNSNGDNQTRSGNSRGTLRSYLVDKTIPNYTPNLEDLSIIVNGEFRNNLTKSREYLKSTRHLDVNHMRACALMEMTSRHFDEARSILQPLYRLHPDNEDILTDLCLLEDASGNDQAFVQYTRALKRLKNRKAALSAETKPSKAKTIHDRRKSTYNRSLVQESEHLSSDPVDVDELVFLSPEDERHVRRTLHSETLMLSPKKPSIVIEWAQEEAQHGYIDKAIEILKHAISFYSTPAEAGVLNMELAKYYFFLNNIPQSTEALKVAMQNPSVKPAAIRQMAEMNELVESPSAALEMYQYAVDQEDSDAQTWKYYLDYLKEHDLNDIYQKVATEALAKFPDSRVLNPHFVASLVKNKQYDQVYTAIEEMVKKNPTSVFTYEYLLSACDTIADPRILNTIYYHATQNIQDNAFIFMQYAEFLEEMDEYDAARDMFYQAYKITPTDDLARSIIRMDIELEDYKAAGEILDVLIDEYSSEVEYRGNKIIWNRNANKFARFCHKENETDNEKVSRDYDDFFKDDEEGNVFDLSRRPVEEEEDEPYHTATYMMPRLLTDKAILACRQGNVAFAEKMFENALELDPSDPYIILNAIEEYYEPSEQWDKIIYLFSILPVVDPNHEFMMEARSLRQSILETIQETEASNKQIYDLYNLPDNSNPHERHETEDYFGRDLHSRSNVNDGFDRYGYQHQNQIDYEHDKELAQFNGGYINEMDVERIPVKMFYPKVPESLQENYSNTNWYELPIMKEWMTTIPDETAGESVDWSKMRNEKGDVTIPYSSVFNEQNEIKVSMKDLEKLRELLSKEYTSMDPAVKEGLKDNEHAYDIKTQEELLKDIRTHLGDSFFDWSFIDTDLKFPVEKEDLALSHLLNDSLKRYIQSDSGKEKQKK